MEQPANAPPPNPDARSARALTPPYPAPGAGPGVWSGLGTVGLYFLLQLGISALAGAAIGFVLAVRAGVEAGLQHSRPNVQAIMALVRTNPNVRIVLTVVTVAAAAAVLTAIVRRAWPAQWARGGVPGLGLAATPRRRAYPLAVVLGFCILLAGGWLTHLLAGHHPVQQDVTIMASHASLGLRVLLVLMVVGVAPFVEELVFRGVLLSGLASRLPVAWAVVASALVFGAAHLPDFSFAWYPVPALIVLGLVLGWLRVYSRSLWPSVTLHATNNLFAAIGWFITMHPR
ncbi:MAG: CPBP family intramembrane metalloprotease [Rhodanobacteraceae bacterium]|nr:MAG: CPBP family intramembrane metalloprotease [Rhodanobacteraceae bacterium]